MKNYCIQIFVCNIVWFLSSPVLMMHYLCGEVVIFGVNIIENRDLVPYRDTTRPNPRASLQMNSQLTTLPLNLLF